MTFQLDVAGARRSGSMARVPEMAPTFVITRADSERARAFRAHAAALGLEVEFSPAVFPGGEAPWTPHYDDAERRRLLGYPMWRGEVGCFLAHREVWRTVVARGLPVALVLEDDAELDAARLGAVAAAAAAITGRRLAVRLVSEPPRSMRVWRELGGGACLGLPVRRGRLTTAYLVTREAAAALLAASERFCFPVDDFMNLVHQHRVDVLHVEPPAARHGAAPSEIGVRLKPPVGPWVRLRREWLRLGRSIRMAVGRLAARRRLGLLLARAEPPR